MGGRVNSPHAEAFVEIYQVIEHLLLQNRLLHMRNMCHLRLLFITKPRELSLASTMTAELSTMPVGVGADVEDVGLVECIWDRTKE